ncbi:pair-rule protein odd-paired-like [Microplitis demolitor]|uniref:pair-rule protein odd-paired-like n=1 Tax=Microplitis demolitor TaxID=69319 RepID=UPI00235B5CDE|nr:pair-rule protein odd-paired-like [Microplitis demolitor]
MGQDLSNIQIGPAQYACPNPNCNRVFSKKYNRNAHVNLYCGKPPRFKCPHCDYKSLLKRNIKDHAHRIHSDVNVEVIELYNPAELENSSRNVSLNNVVQSNETAETLCEPDVKPLLLLQKPKLE